jgi:hypothetical protein
MTRYPSGRVGEAGGGRWRPEPAVVGAHRRTWRELDARADAIAGAPARRHSTGPAWRRNPVGAAWRPSTPSRGSVAWSPLAPGLTPASWRGGQVTPRLVIHDGRRGLARSRRRCDRLDEDGFVPATATRHGVTLPCRTPPLRGHRPDLGDDRPPEGGRPSDGAVGQRRGVAGGASRATSWLRRVGLALVAGLGVVWRAALAGVPLVVPAAPTPRRRGRWAPPSEPRLLGRPLPHGCSSSAGRQPPSTLQTVPSVVVR